MATSKSDKDIHIRRLTGARLPAGNKPQKQVKSVKPGKLAAPRSVAAVDKDAHIRKLTGTTKVAPRGRLSDAATGRLSGTKLGKGGGFNESLHPRDRKGKFR